MSKLSAVFTLALLLIFTLSYAARPVPRQLQENPLKTNQLEGVEAKQVEVENESCERLGDEECLMRRTLAAHLDYIYTQKQNP